MGAQEVAAVRAVLEDHRRMEQVVGVEHGAFNEQLLDPAAAALVPLVQVGGELAAPVGLVLVEQRIGALRTTGVQLSSKSAEPLKGGSRAPAFCRYVRLVR
jgi:hypothetical protein